MSFTPKTWKNSPTTTTPLSAAALEDLEKRVTDFADVKVKVVDQGLWVAPGGSDSNDGLSGGGALATLDKALSMLPTGSTSRGKVTLLSGTYTWPGISRVIDNVEIEGMGGPGQVAALGGGPGGVNIVVPNGEVGLTLGDGTNRFRGPTLRNLHISAESKTALGGIRLRGYSNYLLDRVVISGFLEGYGLFIDNEGQTGYGDVRSSGFHDCLKGIDCLGGGVEIFGGLFDNGDNKAGEVLAESTAVIARGSAAVRAFGARIQSYSTCYDFQSGGGRGSGVFGGRHEGFDIGVQTNQPGTSVFGGSFNNSLYASAKEVASIGTAFKTLSSSSNWIWMPSDIAQMEAELTLDATSPGYFRNSSGTVSSGFSSTFARFQVNSRNASTVAGMFQAFTSQTSDVLQVRNSGGAVKAGMLAAGTLFSDDAAQGLVLKDTQTTPHYWRLTVNNSGELKTADLGTTRPKA